MCSSSRRKGEVYFDSDDDFHGAYGGPHLTIDYFRKRSQKSRSPDWPMPTHQGASAKKGLRRARRSRHSSRCTGPALDGIHHRRRHYRWFA